MMYCVAIDPGVRSAAVSVWEYPTGNLETAFFVEGATTLATADAVSDRLRDYDITSAVIEKPQIYQTAQQKGRQSDITDLTIAVGALAYALYDYPAVDIRLVYPAEWKRQLPKSVSKIRVDAALTDMEKKRIHWPIPSLRHHVIDALHLGLKSFTKRIC